MKDTKEVKESVMNAVLGFMRRLFLIDIERAYLCHMNGITCKYFGRKYLEANGEDENNILKVYVENENTHAACLHCNDEFRVECIRIAGRAYRLCDDIRHTLAISCGECERMFPGLLAGYCDHMNESAKRNDANVDDNYRSVPVGCAGDGEELPYNIVFNHGDRTFIVKELRSSFPIEPEQPKKKRKFHFGRSKDE